MADVATPISVKLSDGRSFTGKVLPIDLVTAERKFGGLSDRTRMEGTFFAAHHALRREGLDIDFDEFLNQLVSYVEGIEDGAPPGNGAGPAGASTSPSSPTERASLPAS